MNIFLRGGDDNDWQEEDTRDEVELRLQQIMNLLDWLTEHSGLEKLYLLKHSPHDSELEWTIAYMSPHPDTASRNCWDSLKDC